MSGLIPQAFTVRTLGGFELISQGESQVSFGSKQARTILAILCLSDGPVFRDELSGILWPEDPVESSRPRLRTEIHRLKESIAGKGKILVVNRESLQLEVDSSAIDIRYIDSLRVLINSETDDNVRLDLFCQALKSANGRLLPIETHPWFDDRRRNWDSSLQNLFETSAHLALRLGQPEKAEHICRKGLSFLTICPLLVRILIESLVAKGDRSEAISTFQRYTERLGKSKADPNLVEYVASIKGHRELQAVEPEQQRHRHELPTRLSAMFGRQTELSELLNLVDPASASYRRLITITGPGGVGKSTVATELAYRSRNIFLDNIFFVKLASAFTDSEMTASIGRAVDANLRPHDDLQAIADRLQSSPTLLILDNLEQLLPSASSWIAKLQTALPNLCIVVTSRVPLKISYEQRFLLQTLVSKDHASLDANHPAVQIFVDRSKRINPQFELTQANALEISTIAYRLDGLPLAIVIAAAKTQFLSPGEIIKELSGFSASTVSNVDIDERHHSVGLAIEWSLNRIEPRLETLLWHLTVFPDDFSSEASIQIIDGMTIDGLSLLIEHSLLQKTHEATTTRFFLLRTISEYLVSKHGQVPEPVTAKYARYYQALIRDVSVKMEASVSSAIVVSLPETTNFTETLGWLQMNDYLGYCQALIHMTVSWSYLSNERRAADWLLTALQKASDYEPSLRADLASCAGRMLLLAGKYDDAERVLQQAISYYQSSGDKRNLLATLRAHLHLYYYRNDFATMVEECQKVLPTAQEANDLLAEAYFNSDLSLALSNLGRSVEALRYAERANEIHCLRGDEARRLNSMVISAVILLTLRNWDRAERVLQEVLAFVQTDDLVSIQSDCHTHLVTCCLRTNRIDDAIKHLDLAKAQSVHVSSAFMDGVRSYLATLLGVKTNNRDLAIRSVQNLFSSWMSVSNSDGVLPAVDLTAYVLASFGETKAATELLNSVDAYRHEHGLAISPHYLITYEDARKLAGPEIRAASPPSISALCQTAKDYLWLI